jgi:(1->4)-alpha-D-glucan 1-alpha-D-glucosylmutase
LGSLNEVGGEIKLPSLELPEFHTLMKARCDAWPHGLSSTATHDTKRGEDTRARLHVLSEVPFEWQAFLLKWDRLAADLIRDLDGQAAPDAVDRYLLLQTLVGTWSTVGRDTAALCSYSDRICEYMTKAMREAKRNTSWLDPSPDYEAAVAAFVRDVLDEAKSQHLMALVDGFVERIARAGYCNSLSQLVLKSTLPGVPDLYQGCELWDFSLVDPDNRRPVDFVARQNQLAEMKSEYEADPQAFLQRFERDWDEPSIKLFVTWQLLLLRTQFGDCFARGSYLPLEVGGEFLAHVIAFARVLENESVVVLVPRCLRELTADTGRVDWGNTYIEVPSNLGNKFRSFLAGGTGNIVSNGKLMVAELMSRLPFEILLSAHASEKYA